MVDVDVFVAVMVVVFLGMVVVVSSVVEEEPQNLTRTTNIQHISI